MKVTSSQLIEAISKLPSENIAEKEVWRVVLQKKAEAITVMETTTNFKFDLEETVITFKYDFQDGEWYLEL